MSPKSPESAFSVAGQVSWQVKRWRPGDMRWRWCAAGPLHAEERFRRVDGYRHIGALLAVIEQTAPNAAVDAAGKVV